CRHEHDLTQRRLAGGELGRTLRIAVLPEEEGDDVGVLLCAQASGSVERHHRGDELVELADASIAPVLLESGSPELLRVMARITVGLKGRTPAISLVRGVDALE